MLHRAVAGVGVGVSAWLCSTFVVSADVSPPGAKLLDAVGDTDLIRLNAVSAITGCEVYGKAEFQNPGGSVKDRPAKAMILEAERTGLLKRGDPASTGIVESSGGNTAVALALLGGALGYPVTLFCPETISQNKISLMRRFGATVHRQPIVPYSHPDHYYHAGRAFAEKTGAFYTNQFENLTNGDAHFKTTGPEIWAQTDGKVDAFVCASGTGGTINGVSRFLKQQNPAVKVLLIDPPGSSLAALVRTGKLTPSPGSTVTEGIGIGRRTANFDTALPAIDGVFDGNDDETVEMQFWLVRHEGLSLGPSAALNVAGAVKAARELGPGHVIVTVLCDGADRYRATTWNPAFRIMRPPKHTEDMNLDWVK